MLPNPGTYRARANGQAVVYQTDAGALCLALPVKLAGEDWEWTGKHTMTIVKQDGTVQSKTVDTLKKVFTWDGADPFWLEDQDLSQTEFDIVGVHDTYTPPDSGEQKTIFKIQWLNPPGESGFKMPESADRKSVLAKYGSKFRALSGGAKVATPAAKPAAAQQEPKKEAPAEPPAKSAGPPGKKPRANTSVQARTATMEEAWDGLCKAHAEITDEAKLEVLWYATTEELFPGKDPSTLSIQEYGAFLDKVEDNVS